MTNIKLPLEILEKCVDRRLWVIMKDDREYSGKLRGFDGFFNMVLDDVTEIQRTPTGSNIQSFESILVNGHDIVFMVPGAQAPDLVSTQP